MINRTCLTGRLTKDPDLRQFQDGTSVANFILAVDRSFKDKNGNNQADFITCKVYGKRAEALNKYVHKGSLIGVDGQIRTGSYENKNGQRVYTTDISVSDWSFLESRNNQQSNGNYQSNGYQQNNNQSDNNDNRDGIYGDAVNAGKKLMDIDDEDLPF